MADTAVCHHRKHTITNTSKAKTRQNQLIRESERTTFASLFPHVGPIRVCLFLYKITKLSLFL